MHGLILSYAGSGFRFGIPGKSSVCVHIGFHRPFILLRPMGSRRGTISRVREDLGRKLVQEFGIGLAKITRQHRVSTSAISQIMRRKESFLVNQLTPCHRLRIGVCRLLVRKELVKDPVLEYPRQGYPEVVPIGG